MPRLKHIGGTVRVVGADRLCPGLYPRAGGVRNDSGCTDIVIEVLNVIVGPYQTADIDTLSAFYSRVTKPAVFSEVRGL
jgi:hypothetical protein